MSTDAFAPVAFPHLQRSAQEREQERARVRGYADGHAEGYRVASESVAAQQERDEAAAAAREAERDGEVAAAVAMLRAAGRALEERAREVTALSLQQVHAAAIELAELILVAELRQGADSALAAVRRAQDAATDEPVRGVRLNADDVAELRRLGVIDSDGVMSGAGGSSGAGAATGARLLADPTLDRGDAVVVLDDGFIDARIQTALARARAAVAENADHGMTADAASAAPAETPVSADRSSR